MSYSDTGSVYYTDVHGLCVYISKWLLGVEFCGRAVVCGSAQCMAGSTGTR